MVKKHRKMEDEADDDVVFEEETQNIGPATIKKLRERLDVCKKEKQEYLDGWQRSKADFQNFKKDSEKDREYFRKFACESIISDILPVLDSFEMAFANKDVWDKVDKSWRDGVEYIYSQLKDALGKNGVENIDPLGDKFDPSLHTPSDTIQSAKEAEDDIIAEVVQKGYTVFGKVLRPARVKVFQYKKD